MRPDEEGERPRAHGDRPTPLPDSAPRALALAGVRRHTTDDDERWVPMNKEFLEDIFERALRNDISGEGSHEAGVGVVRRRSWSPPRDSSRYSDISEATPDEDSDDGKSGIHPDSDSDVILVSTERGAVTSPVRTPRRPSLGDPAPGVVRALPWGVPPGAHPSVLRALADPRARYRTELPLYPPAGLLLPPCCAREIEPGRSLAACHHRSLAHWHTAALLAAPPPPGHGLGLLRARLAPADDMVIIGSAARRPLMRRLGSVGNHSKTSRSDERSPPIHLNRCPQSTVMSSLDDCNRSSSSTRASTGDTMGKSELINQNINIQDNHHLHLRKSDTYKSATMQQQQSLSHGHTTVHSDFASKDNNTNFVIYRPGHKRKSRSNKTRVERQQWIGISKEAIAGILDDLMVTSMSGEEGSTGDSRSNSPASAVTTDTDDNGNLCDSPVQRLQVQQEGETTDSVQTLSNDSSCDDNANSDKCQMGTEDSNSDRLACDNKHQELSGGRRKQITDSCQKLSPGTKQVFTVESESKVQVVSSECSRLVQETDKVSKGEDTCTSRGPSGGSPHRSSPEPSNAAPGQEGDLQQAPNGWVLLTQPLISSMMEEAFTREISPSRDERSQSRSPTPETVADSGERASPSAELQESRKSPETPKSQSKVDHNERAIALLLDIDIPRKPAKSSSQPSSVQKRRLTSDGVGPSHQKSPRLQPAELLGIDLRISKKTSDKQVAAATLEPTTWCGGAPGMWPSSGPGHMLVPGSPHLAAHKSCQHFSQGQVLPQNPLLTPHALAYIEQLKSSTNTAINLATKNTRDLDDPSSTSRKAYTCLSGSSQQQQSRSARRKSQTDDVIDLVTVSPEGIQSKLRTEGEQLPTSRGSSAQPPAPSPSKSRRPRMEPRPGWVAVSKHEVHTIMDSLTSQLFSSASVSDLDPDDSKDGSSTGEDRVPSGSEDSRGGSDSIEGSGEGSSEKGAQTGAVYNLVSGSSSGSPRDGSSPDEEFRRTTIDALNAVYRHEDCLEIGPPTLTDVRQHAREVGSPHSSGDTSPPSVDSMDTPVTMTTIVRERPVRDPAAEGESVLPQSPGSDRGPDSPDPDTRTAADPHSPEGDKKTSFNWKKSILQRVQDDHPATITELPPFPSCSGPELSPTRTKASPRRSPHPQGNRNSKKGKRK